MRTRLLPLLIVLMAAVLLALGVPLGVSLAAAQQQKVVVDRIDDTAYFAAIARPATDAATGSRDVLRVLSRELENYHEVYGIRAGVFLPNDTPLASGPSTWFLPGSGEVRDAFEESLLSRRSHDPQQVWPWQRGRLVVASPVIRDGDVVAVVVTDSPTGPMRSRILHGWLIIGAGLTAAMLVAVGAALRLTGWVLRPVRVLDVTTHEIASGRLKSRVAVASGPPELRRLGHSFNDMAAHVQAASEAQRAFIADASHQLRNPLAALMVRLEGLALAPKERFADAAAAARDDGRYLADTLDRMLELARAEHTRGAAGPLDVAAVVDERLESWNVVAARRSIALRRHGEDRVPAWHDAGALAGAVDAVLDNALKYSPERTAVTVDVRRLDGDRPGVAVVVTDEGPGLAPADLHRVGDRFWRAPSTSGEPGSGLGMSIATTLLERHGGGLRVEPAPDGGLRVSLLVPARESGAPG